MKRPGWYPLISLISLAVLIGCSTIIIDKSKDAFAAGDMTLATSACTASLGGGIDSCRVTVGDTIASAWILIAPKPKTANRVLSGEVDVYYKDVHKQYPVTDWVVQIPWADFFGAQKWSSDQDEAIVEALLTVNWVDNQKIQQITRFRGLAIILVTQPGYDRLPIDSGNQAWGTTCKVQYSTAGRGAVKCQ